MPRRQHQALELLQCNINHSARAQDLLLQHLAEWGISAAIVSEPYFVPPLPTWVGDTEGEVGMTIPRMGDRPPLVKQSAGRGYVAARWGDMILVAVYFAPSRPRREFERLLLEVGRIVAGAAPTPVVVAGDFNAKSPVWGSPVTDLRGRILSDWVVASGLCVLNQGTADTCVRWNGGSIVDVSFATPSAAARVTGWRVLGDVETLSDHLYVRMSVSRPASVRPPSQGRNLPRDRFRKWSLASLDADSAEEAAMIERWRTPSPDRSLDVEERACRFRASLVA
ncbi:uncharacterized protein LOC106141044, partial [Amyelois transitella]|uniref:uncharacterized protein LOC106141044 n=1 Tax=Amyelois transitella TaxID=680683 RepID=UPI00298FADF2